MADKQFIGFVKEKVFSNGGKVINYSLKKDDIDLLAKSLNSSGYVNIDIKQSVSGKMYAEINDWSPSGSGSSTGNTQATIATPSDIDSEPPF